MEVAGIGTSKYSLNTFILQQLTWLNLLVSATTLGASSNLSFFVQPQPDNSCNESSVT